MPPPGSDPKESALIEYLDECTEMMERFSKNPARIERGDKSPDILAAIYRDMHTVKGSSQLFGFAQVGDLAHAMESCLDPVRKGRAEVSSSLVDAMYAGCDLISNLLKGIRETKKEPDLHAQTTGLIPRLAEIAESSLTGAKPIAADKSPSDFTSPKPELAKPAKSKATTEALVIDMSQGYGFFDDPPPAPAAATVSPARLADSPSAAPVSSNQPTQVEPSKAKPPAPELAKASSQDDAQAETIRVHVSLLDSLMNLVGEQVLIRNQLLQHSRQNDEDQDLARLSQRLNVLTAELQSEVMKTRMQPVGNVLNKFTRVVRDMGRDLGKKIDLSILGAETELDKTIIEAIKDPLTHIVRNSVDHGIETPDQRKAAGKSDVGHLTIKAHHESGQVIIEISDDGRGLDPKRIGPKAVEKGLISSEALARMTERDVQGLIFAPGFSTAATVSNISGRGVGMDVVKTNIERIGGLVDLHSVPGSGTTIRLKIPLTLAIVPALIVRALGQRFAIPQSTLVELVMIDDGSAGEDRIEWLQGSPVLRLRGKLLPLLKLSYVLSKGQPARESSSGAEGRVGAAAAVSQQSTTNIVVLSADGFEFGLIVEAVDDTADIVVKSMASFLKDISQFSGATILGDGSVALTLDVMGISINVRSKNEADGQSSVSPGEMEMATMLHHHSDLAEYLLVDVGAPGSYAIPLTLVSRLEEFAPEDVELSGEQRVVCYRDSLLPVLSLPKFLQLPFESKRPAGSKVPVVVIRRGDSLFGIEVLEIRDVESLPSAIDQSVRDRPGVLGTMIAGHDVLVVVDILGMIDKVRTRLATDAGVLSVVASTQGRISDPDSRRTRRILVVEDSSFFRGYIRQVLTEAGYQADGCHDGAEAWKVLDATAAACTYHLVLSDIEMPIMNGFELANRISSDPRMRGLPLVAITTRFSKSDIERGRQAGFARYLEKLNPETLIAALDELLSNSSMTLNASSNAGKESQRAVGT